jgi:hypothetical protein
MQSAQLDDRSDSSGQRRAGACVIMSRRGSLKPSELTSDDIVWPQGHQRCGALALPLGQEGDGGAAMHVRLCSHTRFQPTQVLPLIGVERAPRRSSSTPASSAPSVLRHTAGCLRRKTTRLRRRWGQTRPAP